MRKAKAIQLPSVRLQIDFARLLREVRTLFLQDALSEAVSGLSISVLDDELDAFVSKEGISQLAKHGLRGELMFATPSVLRANPFLLGYYRSLLGYSRKEFYKSVYGTSSLKRFEDVGKISTDAELRLPELCRCLNVAAADLLQAIGVHPVTKAILDDLTLLTLGPQLRGNRNVQLGIGAITSVFEVVSEICRPAIVAETASRIELKNSADRKVIVQLAADPDLVIWEQLSSVSDRKIIAIEVKGGTDVSNIHNRIGEAEKSHQKAKADGYTQRWTIVNVENLDEKKAKEESPSTDRFFRLAALRSGKGAEFDTFKALLLSNTSLRMASRVKRKR